MKRPVLVVLGILLIAFISIYYIIPQKIELSRTVEIDATDVNIARFLVDKGNWQKWWPGKHDKAQQGIFAYKGIDIILHKTTATSAEVLIKTKKLELPGEITYIAIDQGSSKVTWAAGMQSSLNPFERISQYFDIKSKGREIEAILGSFKRFMQADSNVYGINVKVSKIKDNIMLATTGMATEYPSMDFVYGLIDKARAQVSALKLKETNRPMLNIHKTDNNQYQVMVAIPVNREFTPPKGFVLNRMLLGGNILETEITGGKNKLMNAFTQLENYMHNHELRSPAMPFESLITNRITEPDSAKWVTKVYYPIY